MPVGLKDSKKLSKQQREALFSSIKKSCDLGEGWVSAPEIDELGLTKAMELGVKRALNALGATAKEEIIMDGLINYCEPVYQNVTCVAKADDTYPIVSAASIYAKVTRDRHMSNLGDDYYKYQFDRHVGYGTALHREMIELFGLCDQHRLSFAPIKKFASL
jgi:ribonuclease HII